MICLIVRIRADHYFFLRDMAFLAEINDIAVSE